MSTDLLVFSKDRACQLDLFLTSIKEKCFNIKNVSVIYTFSNENFGKAYQQCQRNHSSINFLKEENFQFQVKQWVNNENRSQTIMFAVDDDIFKENIDFNEISQILLTNPQILCYSSRLGLQLTHCYSLDKVQPIPNGNVMNGYFIWDWKTSNYDWQYMFSVDGHVFRTNEIAAWVSSFDFSNPNNFEDAIQNIKNHFVIQNLAFCHVNSKMFNTPMNRVQNTHKNRCGNISYVEMNEIYLSGKRLNSQEYYKIIPTSCHVDSEAFWSNS